MLHPIPLEFNELPLKAFSALLSCPEQWPIWLNDADSWCLAMLPAWVLVQQLEDLLLFKRLTEGHYHVEVISGDFKTLLKVMLANEQPLYALEKGFSGGLMGWMSYDFQNHHPDSTHKVNFPAACFAFYDVFIRPNNEGKAHLFASNAKLAQRVLTQIHEKNQSTAFTLSSPFENLMDNSEYTSAFNRVHDYLHSGDCYQVNLAQAFKAQCQGNSLDAFVELLALSKPPYAAYVNNCFGEILSLSPELFLQFSEDGTVLTRPIKGTRPRKTDALADRAEFNDLAHHPKDKAENLMIVDLLRNDLGQHATIGSVSVPELFKVESFPQVHHLISTVTCQLHPDSHPLDLLFDAFPGGSITGAPKKRAMEIIDELENCQRAIYCGSIGYLTPEGRGQWNIAIRTLLRVGNDIYAWAGGGIVADSDCESEYQECFNKIGAMLTALEDAFLP